MNLVTFLRRIQKALSNPKAELTRWERFALYLWQLARQGIRQLSQDRASMMAASLTYRTLFGLLPVTVVGAGVAISIMGAQRFHVFLHDLIRATGLDEVYIDSNQGGDSLSLGKWIDDIISSGMNINVAALTWISVLVLVYSSIALMSTIESCFNYIFREKHGRSWLRKIPLYWFLLTFGPVLLAVAFWADGQANVIFEILIPWHWLQVCVTILWKLFVTWVSLFLLYTLIPTAKVKRKPAMIGALVSSLLLLAGKESLGLYFSHAISLKQLYGSLGLVPVFMFWLYVMWLITLLGLQIAAIIQEVSTQNDCEDE